MKLYISYQHWILYIHIKKLVTYNANVDTCQGMTYALPTSAPTVTAEILPVIDNSVHFSRATNISLDELSKAELCIIAVVGGTGDSGNTSLHARAMKCRRVLDPLSFVIINTETLRGKYYYIIYDYGTYLEYIHMWFLVDIACEWNRIKNNENKSMRVTRAVGSLCI